MKIRSIEVSDIFTVARILGKVAKGTREELAAAIMSEKPDVNALGMVLFQSICIDAEEDLKAWLADLAGKKVEVFLKMPATTIFDVIEGLMAQEDIKAFFVRASGLADKLTSGS